MDCSTPTFEFCQRRVHMIGIGGCGMSGAAAILLRLGAHVSGSDMYEFPGMGALVRDGARITIGHDERLLSAHTDLVVISAAIPETNPELAAARASNLTVIKYAELIGGLMRHRRGVAISGTHGKSTTSAMCVHLFREAGLDPSFIFGATSEQLGGGSGVGDGEHFIVESCEYGRSFLHFSPRSAAILNIEPDHLDCYASFDDIVDAFADFGGRVHAGGLVVCNAHDASVAQAVREVGANIETFGFSGEADWKAVNLNATLGCYEFDVWHKGSYFLSTWLCVPGRYNVANALAAVALAHEAGADKTSLAMALPTFAGIERRLTWRGEGRGVTVVDDYAHHPTEVRLTIEAAQHRYEPKRTWVVFQPHQYERTHQLMEGFAMCFEQADEVIVPDIYAARESNGQAAAGSRELVSRIRLNGGRAHYLATLQAAADHVVKHACHGDLVLTMGAGDVWKVADELVERICGPDRLERPAGPADLVQAGGTCEVSVSTA